MRPTASVRALLLVALAAGAGACTIEDRTPRGSQADHAAIQRLIRDYHRGGDTTGRTLGAVRIDLRQEGDVAAAWVVARPGSASASELTEHFVLRRGADGWRIAHVEVAGPRRGGRGAS